MVFVYFLVDIFGLYEELFGDKKNGYKKVVFVDEFMEIKKKMFYLFLEGDVYLDVNKIFLFKEKKELNVRKNMEIEDGMIVIFFVLDVIVIGIFLKGIDLV